MAAQRLRSLCWCTFCGAAAAVNGSAASCRTRGPELLQTRAALSELAGARPISSGLCRDSVHCEVPVDETWLLDASLTVETLTVYGTLRWDQNKPNLELRANYILVPSGGQFILGTVSSPMDLPATVYITDGPHSHPQLGRRFLGGLGGSVEIHGRRLVRTWSLLSQTAMPGQNVLYLKHDPAEMGWRVGDRIGLATTSRGESTVHRILGLAQNQVTLQEQVMHEHWGGYKSIEGRRFELAAEVVNLERSVVITGDHQDIEVSMEGLHTIQAGSGHMDLRYARIEHCGQRPVMGRYCLHFHLMRKCPRCVFQGNAVVDGEHVGITVHGTHNSLVDQNIVWDAKANGLYIEDGNELYNTLSQNVAVCTNLRKCAVDWVSGVAVQTAGIFMIGMTNHIVENRVVGYENGIWTPGSFRGSGHGLAFGKTCPQFYPFGEWRGNTCHDCHRFGLYLDHQYPRNVKIDDDGFLLDKESCDWFTRSGDDNGVVNEIRDEVNWHNTYVGQYAIGDIQYINYTSINNGHAMYWKQGKNFVDKRPWHVLDSTFANDPADKFGVLQFLGPSGPFAFGMKNCVFLGGGPPGTAALAAGQHCGLLGGAGPCNVQYMLENVDFSQMRVLQPRLAFGANTDAAQAAVLPVFLARDGSLGGFRSILSRHLSSFRATGCQDLDEAWAKGGALGCNAMVRRLNVWGEGAGRMQLAGAGYGGTPDWSFPTEGRNAGEVPFDAGHMGYGALVLVGQTYVLTASWNTDMILEFSDPVLGEYYESDSSIDLEVGSGRCKLKESDDRKFICDMGEFGGLCDFRTSYNQHRITGGRLKCAGSSPPPVPVPITTPPPSPNPSPSPSPRPGPVNFPPLSGSAAGWILHVGLNCWENHGAAPVAGADPMPGTFTIESCRRQCEKEVACAVAVVRHGWDDGSSPCFLRTDLQLERCRDYADFDVWEIKRVATVTITSTPGSSTSPAVTTTTTTTTTTLLTEFEGVDGGIDRACRGAFSGDNRPSYYVLQYGVMGLEGCKSICITDALCQGIEFSASRCELWTRPGGIQASIPLRGFTCLRFNGAPTTTPFPMPFTPVDGGTDRACRGKSADDNSGNYYTLVAGRLDLNECKARCVETWGCKGIEHSTRGRCELWTRDGGIEASRQVGGFTCLRFERGPEWNRKEGLNCYDGHGAKALESIADFLPVDDCKAECMNRDLCEGMVVRAGWDESPCWLYTDISLNDCLAVPDYDVWHLS